MPEYVRVKQKETGHELSVPVAHLEAYPDGYAEVKKDAVDAAGDPLPPKYKTSVSTEAAKSNTSGQKAASEKENS